MTHIPTESLKAIAHSDAHLAATAKQLTDSQQLCISFTEQIKELNAKNQDFSHQISEKKKNLHELEVTVQALRDEINRKHAATHTVTTQKQQHALEHELKVLEEELEAVSDEQVDILYALEDVSKQYDAFVPTMHTTRQQLEQQLVTTQAHCVALQEELVTGKARHLELEAALPGEWQTRYLAMKKKLSDPIVPVRNDACGGCYYPLQPNVLVKTRHGEIISCTICNRMVFAEPPTPAPQPAA